MIMLLTSTVLVFIIIPPTLAAEVTMEVYQQSGNKVIGRNTRLDIFNNPKLGGQKLIAPNTAGSYTFAVYNNSDSDELPYTLNFWETNPDMIPLVFSIQKNGTYILGGSRTEDMVSRAELQLPETSLTGGKTDVYTLKWKWITKNDISDTALGRQGNSVYSLMIETVGSIPMIEHNIDTGDRSDMIFWGIGICALLTLVLFLFLNRRGKKDENNEMVLKSR